MDHFPYLFAAYTLIFLAIFLYVAFIWRRQSRLAAEIDQLQSELRALSDRARGSGSSAPAVGGAEPGNLAP
jgi:CcmD family protein